MRFHLGTPLRFCIMTERANKDQLRRSLSLSKSKKKGNVTAGISASPANTTPISSFFSSQPPSKMACPLCGQLVPRFRINEHIDLQCQNFERGDSSAASASKSVVPSIQLSPKKSSPKSPELDRKKEAEVKETKTSPYFKKNNFQQEEREIHSKTVVRTIDLGSLSSKLSKRYRKVTERTQTDDKHAPVHPETERDPPDALSCSQKENVLIQSLQDNKDCVTVIDLTAASGEMPTTDVSCSEKGHNLEHKASKSETIQRAVTAKHSSSSKLAKRKKETTSTGKVSGYRKKAKYEGTSREPEDVLSTESTADTTDSDQHKTEVPSSTLCDAPLSSEEVCEKSAAVIKSDSLPESVAEQTTSDQAVRTSYPPRLPYYLQNFRTVLQAVLDNEDDRALFNQDDMSLVHAFEKLSGMLEHHSILVTKIFANEIRPNFSCVFSLSKSWGRSCM